jgi:hypothetical protein
MAALARCMVCVDAALLLLRGLGLQQRMRCCHDDSWSPLAAHCRLWCAMCSAHHHDLGPISDACIQTMCSTNMYTNCQFND